MKLILCEHCKDVVALRLENRKCFCGRCGGAYLKDGLNALIWGDCIPLGFENISFISALKNQPDNGMGRRFEAFVIPKECNTISRAEDLYHGETAEKLQPLSDRALMQLFKNDKED